MSAGPRSHRRYTQTRAAWIAGFGGGTAPCHLCGLPVDTSLPGTHKWGPTVEHLLPVRHIRAIAADRAQQLDLICDTSTWALAHLHCQRRQGGRATRPKKLRPAARTAGTSRAW